MEAFRRKIGRIPAMDQGRTGSDTPWLAGGPTKNNCLCWCWDTASWALGINGPDGIAMLGYLTYTPVTITSRCEPSINRLARRPRRQQGQQKGSRRLHGMR